MEIFKNVAYCIAFCFGFVCTYTGLSQEAITILSVLMIFDTITGYTKVAVLGKKPTTTRLSIGIVSKVLLLLIPFTIALVGKNVGIDLLRIASGSIMTITLSEAMSIVANIYVIRTKKNLPEFDIISMMLKKLNNMLLSISQKNE